LIRKYDLSDDFDLAVTDKIGRPEFVAKIGKISGLAGLITTGTSFILKLIALENPDNASPNNNALSQAQMAVTVVNGACLLTGFITYVQSGGKIVELVKEENRIVKKGEQSIVLSHQARIVGLSAELVKFQELKTFTLGSPSAQSAGDDFRFSRTRRNSSEGIPPNIYEREERKNRNKAGAGVS